MQTNVLAGISDLHYLDTNNIVFLVSFEETNIDSYLKTWTRQLADIWQPLWRSGHKLNEQNNAKLNKHNVLHDCIDGAIWNTFCTLCLLPLKIQHCSRTHKLPASKRVQISCWWLNTLSNYVRYLLIQPLLWHGH